MPGSAPNVGAAPSSEGELFPEDLGPENVGLTPSLEAGAKAGPAPSRGNCFMDEEGSFPEGAAAAGVTGEVGEAEAFLLGRVGERGGGPIAVLAAAAAAAAAAVAAAVAI